MSYYKYSFSSSFNPFVLANSIFDEISVQNKKNFAQNISSKKDVLEYQVLLPGVEKEDISVDLLDNSEYKNSDNNSSLLISYKIRGESDSYLINLRQKVKEKNISLKYKNGILYVSLKKDPEEEPKRARLKVE